MISDGRKNWKIFELFLMLYEELQKDKETYYMRNKKIAELASVTESAEKFQRCNVVQGDHSALEQE